MQGKISGKRKISGEKGRTREMVISANKGKISGKGKVSSKTARTREHQNSAKKRDDLGAREDLGEKGKKSADGDLGEQAATQPEPVVSGTTS